MTAYSKGAKRRINRAKWRQAESMGLAPTPKRDKNGCFTERQRQQEEDPQKTVREARMRHTGKPAEEVLRPMYCDEAGQAIAYEATSPDEAAKLWQIYTTYDGVDDRWSKYVIGQNRFEKTAKLEFLPDRLETRPDDRPDLRSEEERIRDARNAWEHWQGYLNQIGRWERIVINRAVRREDELMKGARPTVRGIALVRALRMLREVVEK